MQQRPRSSAARWAANVAVVVAAPSAVPAARSVAEMLNGKPSAIALLGPRGGRVAAAAALRFACVAGGASDARDGVGGRDGATSAMTTTGVRCGAAGRGATRSEGARSGRVQ